MPAAKPDASLVPARYISEYATVLMPGLHCFDADGTPFFQRLRADGKGRRPSQELAPGDTILVPPHEVYGQTYFIDRTGNREPLYLGPGHVVLPEHAGKSREELLALGYEFHSGRADFEEMMPFAAYQKRQQEAKATTPAPHSEPQPKQETRVSHPIDETSPSQEEPSSDAEHASPSEETPPEDSTSAE